MNNNIFNKKCPLTNKEKMYLILHGLRCTQILRDSKGNYLGLNLKKFKVDERGHQPGDVPAVMIYPELCGNCIWDDFEVYFGCVK